MRTWHRGKKAIHTSTIVVQVQTDETKEKWDLFWETFPNRSASVDGRDEKHLRRCCRRTPNQRAGTEELSNYLRTAVDKLGVWTRLELALNVAGHGGAWRGEPASATG
jgi:hypothetical protein